MEDKNEMMDQTLVAESVGNKIKYDFNDFFLVKPLDPIKVKKEFTKLPEDKKPVKDKNGIEAVDVKDSDIETEVKEVNSDYRKAVVLTVPTSYKNAIKEGSSLHVINVGDVVIYKEGRSLWFDLIKDTQLLRGYDIIAVESK